MLSINDDSTTADYSSGSVGNPIDVEWRRAMDDLRRQEEIAMQRGTYNYGFTEIDPRQVQNTVANPFDWKSQLAGE